MDILYLLIPLSALLMLGLLGLFAWALNGGQFDELEQQGQRILEGDASNLTVIKPSLSQPPRMPASVLNSSGDLQ